MKFNSQICTTRVQSERLLALGLKKETADMTYLNDKICVAPYNEMECPYDNLVKPAWSLQRLIEIFKKGINISEYLVCSNAYNEIIDDIEYEIKEGHFNKEYLEE